MSKRIEFDNGLKTFTVNDSGEIQFNPNDINILNRIELAIKNIDLISEKYKSVNESDNPIKLFNDCDKDIRENINYIFGSDVCTVAFGNANCMSISNGEPIHINFLNAVVPIIKQEIKAEQKKSAKRIEKYTKQVKK